MDFSQPEKNMISRPDWDTYFMDMAYLVARRSIDKSTKVGCVITKNKSVISTGYNSPPRGMIDSEVPTKKDY
jgi:dCMP deaminase